MNITITPEFLTSGCLRGKIILYRLMLPALLFITGFTAGASAQITIRLKDAPVESVFKAIEQQTDYVFFYKSNLKDVSVSISAQNSPIKEVLDHIFTNKPFTYRIVGKTIAVTDLRKNNPTPAKPVDTLIRGKVTDTTGAPLSGVTIRVSGKQEGAYTDDNGLYKVRVKNMTGTLVFSYIGMQEQRVPIDGQYAINVVLHKKPLTADAVVVTGYFKQDKSTYTGSAITFSGEQLKAIAPDNIFEALSLVTPGLVKTENNNLGSNPNALPEILIRGVTSFANNNQQVNQPLIVRDGTIISIQDLYDMNINEIASVTILKDASAAALYGAKAANGVIVIERKPLTSGKMKVIYNFTGQMQFPDFSSYHLLNPRDKLEYERLAGLYHSDDPVQQEQLDSLYNERLMDVNRGVNTDWMAKPSRIGYSQDHSLRLNGGAGNTRYELNLRLGTVNGVMKGDYRRRYGLGFTLEYHTKSGLTFSNRTTLSEVDIRYSPYGSFSKYTETNPYDRVRDQFGALKKTLSWDMDNPLYEAGLGSFSKAKTKSLSNDFNFRWILSNRFTATSHINFRMDGGNTAQYTSPLSGIFKDITDLSKRGSMNITNNNGLTYSGNIVLSYNQMFAKQSLLTARIGGNINHTDLNSYAFSGVGFYADALKSINFATSYPEGGAPGGSQDLNSDLGGFLNLNYTFRNRYYLDGIYQISGSSKFGVNNRYSHFWSAGLGWNIHNESFLDNDWLDIFRLRGSIGYTGKVSFASYQALTTYRYNVNLNYLNGIGAVPVTIGNPDLKWERTLNYNAGLDLFFLHRFNLTADLYLRRTTDLVIDKTIPPSAGVTMGKENLGQMENRGIEIKLDAYIIKSKDWLWQVGGILMHNRNKILKISDALEAQNDINNKLNTVEPLPQFQEGESTTALKVVPSAGIDPATGKEVYIKLNGNRTFVYDPADKRVVGDLLPKVQGTLYSTLSYGGFTLAAYFQYLYDQYVYNTTLATKVEGSDPKYNADYRVFADRWKKPGDVALYRDIADKSLPYQSSRFVARENTLSLSRLNLSYQFEKNWLDGLGINKASVGISMNDVFRLSTVDIERGTDYLYSRGIDINLNVIF